MADLTIVNTSNEIMKGVQLVDEGRLEGALKHFSALQVAPDQNPVVASFIGMIKALRDNQPFQGIEVCKRAVSQDPDEPLCYMNLARIYMAMNDRYHAVKAIHKGLRSRNKTRELLFTYYKAIGIRRQPPVKFLDRNHPVNKVLGKMTFKEK
jgi:predicted Zn-dependent protease